jgi:hypothetical protein
MIVEKRTYTLKVGTTAAFLKAYEEHGLSIQARVLGPPLGYYSTEIGNPNQIVQLWGYQDFADRQRRRTELLSLVEWHEALAHFRPFIEQQENVILNPASFMQGSRF